jgi:hypothetical protein
MSHVIIPAEYDHFPGPIPQVILPMILLYVLIGLSGLIAWLLLSTIVVSIDTGIPEFTVKWLFFRRKWPSVTKKKKPKIHPSRHSTTPAPGKRPAPERIIRTLKKCRIDSFELSLDTGSSVFNAWLYPLNFIPLPASRTIRINFEDDNRLRLQVSAQLWRLLAAWIK